MGNCNWPSLIMCETMQACLQADQNWHISIKLKYINIPAFTFKWSIGLHSQATTKKHQHTHYMLHGCISINKQRGECITYVSITDGTFQTPHCGMGIQLWHYHLASKPVNPCSILASQAIWLPSHQFVMLNITANVLLILEIPRKYHFSNTFTV